ncbi:hypothetical protein KO527_10760 [Pseudoalteromonas sp. C2R02]|uniref:ABC-three component system middle component 5 n=1 Tax=Pseudoalteromonas sp. C2R02 TaxID=2841565 RepID=UPI001C086611|nr:ABC-three component system middle component 5 [Pseudoalteromonas sp. C2R02]MBU2969827.1 hypothetical protein [Pseudoalteromonas sp. C2R02]
MLLYNKALDPNHTLLRVVSILIKLKITEIERDRIRIFDFLVANPAYIVKISISKNLLKEKNKFKGYENRYQNYNPINLFESMSSIHDSVIFTLVAMGVLTELQDNDRYNFNLDNLPSDIKKIALDIENSISDQAINFICNYLQEIKLTGDKGLKCISKLMEYKYDAF